MASETVPKLPVIDFTRGNLKPGTSSWLSASSNIRRALEDYGCFMAVYDKMAPDLDREVFCALKNLFDLPQETKEKNTSEKPFHGYFVNRPTSPLLESMGIEDAASPESIQSFTSLMWPNGNDHFCETMHSYTKVASELNQIVTRMVFESYGVEKYCDSHLTSTTYLLRVLRYRPPQTNETNVGAQVHTDKSFITVLHQDQVNGLEVKTKANKWIAIEFPLSSFIVMAGDGLLAWSNGRVHAPLHQVIMRGNEARYSLGMFSSPRGTVKIPEELVDDEHPLQFKSFDHCGLLRFFATGGGQHNQSTAKQYCGI